MLHHQHGRWYNWNWLRLLSPLFILVSPVSPASKGSVLGCGCCVCVWLYAVWAGVCVLVRIDNIISIPLRCLPARGRPIRDNRHGIWSLESSEAGQLCFTRWNWACNHWAGWCIALTHLVFMGYKHTYFKLLLYRVTHKKPWHCPYKVTKREQ